MWIFNSVFGKIFDLFFLPFRNLSPWFGMIVISLLTGLLMLWIFRLTSNQEGIKKVKNKIKAHLLELRLYKDSLNLTLRAQRSILGANLRYLSYSLKPLLIMIVPIVLILVQINFWFGYESLGLGQEAILKVKLLEGKNPLDTEISIEPNAAVSIETPPLRLEEEREINWRLRVKEKGIRELTMKWDKQTFTKKIAAGQNRLIRLSPLRVKHNLIAELFHPGERPLFKGLPIVSIEITYPAQRMNLFGWHIHWLIAYFVLSIIFGFALKRPFKVEI